MKIASYSVETNNLGDHIQIIAQLKLLSQLGLEPEVYLDRDSGIQPRGTDDYFLVMNGWHKRQGHIWPPSNNITPLFIGFHARNKKGLFDNVSNFKSVEYLKRHTPVGCRDLHTFNLLRDLNVDCYVSNCLTTTFPKRDKKLTQTKIFVSSRDDKILGILPENIRSQCEYITHYSKSTDFKTNMELAQQLLDNYRDNAKLVITTFLHCALPCIAMGIPVIVLYPDFDINSTHHLSDKQRMSTLISTTPCYYFDEVSYIDWNPPVIDTEKHKQVLVNTFNTRVNELLK